LPKIGILGPFSQNRPFSGLRPLFQALPQGWFYINPSRRGPVPAKKGFSGVSPGKGLKRHFSGIFPIFPENGLFWDPEGVWKPGFRRALPAGDRAPARGVDVKPPSRRGPDPGTGVPRGRGLARDLGEGPRRPSGGPRGPPRGLGGPPGLPEGLVLHQPLAAGPCPRQGALPGTRVPRPLLKGRGLSTPAPYRGGGEPRRAGSRGGRRLRIR